MSDLNDTLQGIANDAWNHSDTGKQVDLVNLDFIFLDVETVEWEDQETKETKDGRVGTIDKGEGPERYWLDGALVRPQVDYMVEQGLLPHRMRLIRDGERRGSPYILQALGGAAPELGADVPFESAPAAVAEDEFPDSAFWAACKDHGLLTQADVHALWDIEHKAGAMKHETERRAKALKMTVPDCWRLQTKEIAKRIENRTAKEEIGIAE